MPLAPCVRRVAVAALATVVSACSGGGGSGGLQPPGHFTARWDPASFDLIVLEWDAVPGADALEAQGRIDAEPWETYPDPIRADSVGAMLWLQQDAPEAATYSFRLRARQGGASSAWSNVATFTRGVRPARAVQVFSQPGAPTIQVRWERGSLQADAIRVERRTVRADGAAGSWSAIPGVALDATTYIDSDLSGWVDGASYGYRVVYVKKGVESAPAAEQSGAAPPLAPTGLVATAAGPTAIRLDWTPRSTYADRQVVERMVNASFGYTEVVTLPAGATSYLDITVPSPGIYTYRISARVGPYVNVTNFVANGDPALGFTTLPGDPYRMSSVYIPLQRQTTAPPLFARDPGGAFAVLTETSSPPGLTVSRATPSGWDVHASTMDQYPEPPHSGLQFDARGNLHAVYGVRHFGDVEYTLVHEWFDGTWHKDDGARARVFDVALDASGVVHAVDCESGRYLTNAMGTWGTPEALSPSLPSLRAPCALAVTPGGAAKLAYVGAGNSGYELHVATRGGGGWSDEVVPVGADGVDGNWSALLHLFAPDDRTTLVVYQAGWIVNVFDTRIRAVARGATGWGAPEQVGTRAFNGSTEGIAAAMSPAGDRAVVAWNGTTYQGSGSPATIAVRDANGSWTATPVLESPGEVAAGFTPAGKLWVLYGGSGPASMLYEE